MSVRVAVASKDGVMVHQHFGRATHFQIYDLDEAGFQFVETRENTPSCHFDQTAEGESHEPVVRLLADCRIVLVARIGPGATQVLRSRGLTAYETPMYIEDALQRLVAVSKMKIISKGGN